MVPAGQRSVAVGLAVAALLAAACAPVRPPEVSPAGRAALIVVGPQGAAQSICVTLASSGMTGRGLLEASALPVVLDERNAMGALVCSIDELGCSFPAEPCLCMCEQIGDCTYWAYFVRTPPGDWVYSTQGVSAQPVNAGELHAWIWLNASLTGTAALDLLPHVEFEAVCP